MIRYGIKYSSGEIVLIPVAFTDLTSSKKRPVVILSNYEYISGSDDLIEEVIPKESCKRADKIYKLNQSIIVRKNRKLKEIKLEAALK